MRLGGKFNGQQIVPSAAVDDIRRGGDRKAFVSGNYATLPGWSNRPDVSALQRCDSAIGTQPARSWQDFQAGFCDPERPSILKSFSTPPVPAAAVPR